MRVIDKLREFFTIEEAAKHLSIKLNENVEPADVLRLAIDKHLVLSINIVNSTAAKPCDRIPTCTSTKDHKIPPFGYAEIDGNVIVPAEKGETITGIFRLLMICSELEDIKSRYQKLTGGAEIKRINVNGCLVADKNTTYQLQHTSKDKRKEIKQTKNPNVSEGA